MSDRMKYELWDFLARLCAVIPPLGATLFFFPEWIEQSPRATFSGMLLVATLICMVPFWKKILQISKSFSSTSMPVFWIILFAVFFVVRDIVDRIMYISLFGLLGSGISMAVCIMRNKYAYALSKETDKEGKNK